MTSLPGRFLIWIFKSCLTSSKADENGVNFYEILEITKNSTPEEIKKAYKKKSLQFHPDKLQQRGLEVTEEMKAEFQLINRAYEVLTDPKKKQIFDALGERGVRWSEDPSSMSMSEIQDNFLDSSLGARCNLVGLLVFIIGLILLFPILLCAKLDGDIDGDWAAVWTPIWMFLGLKFVLKTLDLFEDYSQPPEGWNVEENGEWVNPSPILERIFEWIQDFLFFLFQIFLVMRLDHDISWNWGMVFFPWILWELTLILEKYLVLLKKVPELPDLNEGEFNAEREELKMKRYQIIAEQFEAWRSIPLYFVRILFAIFLTIKLNGADMSYGVVFLPCWIYLGILIWIYSHDKRKFKEYSAALPEDGNPLNVPPEDEEKAAKASLYYQALSSMSCNFILLLVMGSVAAAYADGDDFSAFWIFFPIFLIFGCVCCMGTCMITCAGRVDDDITEDGYTPPDEQEVLINEGTPVTNPPQNSHSIPNQDIENTYQTFNTNTDTDVNQKEDKEVSKNDDVIDESSIHADID